jgi:Concanavalin A-like lectin/glucanases superfamily
MKGNGIFIALMGAAALATSAPASAATGPAAHWRFDEGGGSTAADASGNGNIGTVEGGATWIAGKRNGALAFDGSTGVVRVPSSSSLEPQAVTVSAWVRRSGSPGAYKYILGKGALACLSASYGLYTGPGGGLMFYVADGTDFTRSPDAGTAVWDDAWHHVAGTFDGTSVRLFLDGAEIAGGTSRTTPITYTSQTATDLLLGDYAGCGGLAFGGAIDEPKIWGRALSATEVAADMRFEFKGFFSPVDNSPVLNVAKAGSSVPVKFSLTGYQGMDILASGSPGSQAVSCNDSVSPDTIEQTATAGASGLTYDAASDHYIYVWKTDKAWSGSCRQFLLRLADGSLRTASFRFAK